MKLPMPVIEIGMFGWTEYFVVTSKRPVSQAKVLDPIPGLLLHIVETEI